MSLWSCSDAITLTLNKTHCWLCKVIFLLSFVDYKLNLYRDEEAAARTAVSQVLCGSQQHMNSL